MTDQQMHERLEAAGARWREQKATPLIADFAPPPRQLPSVRAHRVTWLVTAAAVIAAAVGITIPLLSGGGTAQPPAGDSSGLYGVRWTWSSSEVGVGGSRPLPPNFDLARAPFLRFEPGGRVVGSDGCNSVSGPARVEGDAIIFGQLYRSYEICHGALWKQAGEINGVLRGRVTWRIVCNVLMLQGHTGELDYDAPHRTRADMECLTRWSNKHAVK